MNGIRTTKKISMVGKEITRIIRILTFNFFQCVGPVESDDSQSDAVEEEDGTDYIG